MSGQVAQVQEITRSFQQEYRKTPTQLKVVYVLTAVVILLGCHQQVLISLLGNSVSCTQAWAGLQVIDCFLVYAILTAAIQV